ncbi:MAG TPA: RNA polymerase sigma factor SigI [Bacillaceae bacterium]
MKPLLSLLFLRQKKQTLEETALSIQAGDVKLLNSTIHKYKPFVKKTVSSVCKRYIDDSDDEFSIGLIAFNDALYKYEKSKGASVLAFAEVMIRRRVIDYIRQQAKHQNISMEKGMLEDGEENAQLTIEHTLSFEEYEREQTAEARREEIMYYSLALAEYGLQFEDLADQAPKHEDARVNAMKVAKVVAENKEMLQYLQEKKRLPMKQLQQKVEVSRKTIERNRKYIIAIVIIMIGDYIFLKDYIKGRLNG